jgi:hypothetical protein
MNEREKLLFTKKNAYDVIDGRTGRRSRLL